MINKKGQGASRLLIIFVAIMMFSLISLIAVIGGYLFYAVGNDYVVLPLYNASLGFNESVEITAGFESTVGSYQGLDLSFIDDMWFFGYFVLIILSFSMAYRTKSTNYFSWLSMLTYGLMFVLFIVGLFLTIMQWLYFDILQNLFLNLAVNVPKLEYFILNYGFIFLLHAAGLMLINIVDFDFAFISGRKKKEQQILNDDELV